jgi:hypothetical protein
VFSRLGAHACRQPLGHMWTCRQRARMRGWHVGVVVVLRVVVSLLWGACLWAVIWGFVDMPPGGMHAQAACAQCCESWFGCLGVCVCGRLLGHLWYAASGHVCVGSMCVLL